MSTLLAIETATEACSVALYRDGEIIERHELAPRRHAELLLPWCDALLAEAGVAKSQLDAIAVGRGPGGFTGVRLAVAAVQGMAMGLDRPVLPVSTLAALALSAESAGRRDLPILSTIDARMGEVYAALFDWSDDGLLRALDVEVIATPQSLSLPEAASLLGVGSGFAAADGLLRQRCGARLAYCDDAALPHAAAVARLAARDFAAGLGIAPERLEPAYLRNKVALTLDEQQAARRDKVQDAAP